MSDKKRYKDKKQGDCRGNSKKMYLCNFIQKKEDGK
jgi:hypothetical protein